jgi:phage-related minor tail protein
MPEAKLDVIVDPSGAITGSSQAKQAINSINDSTRKMATEMEKARQAQERINAATQRMVGAIRAAGTAWLVYKGIMSTYIRNSVEAEKVSTQLDAVLKSTKSAAGLTAVEIKNMASEMQMLTTFGDEEVVSMQNLLLTFKHIKGDTFKQATMAILDLSTAMGTDLSSAAIQVGKALNDPKIGLTALQRVGITFNQSQKDMIKKFQETGKVAEAQKIILKELESQFGGSAKAATNNLGGALAQLKNKFGDLFEINATDEFNAITTAIKELTKALDTEPVKEFTQELGKLVAGGIETATKGLKLMADNVDTLKDALGALMAMKVGSWFGGLQGAIIGGAGYILGKGAYDFVKNDQAQAKITMDMLKREQGGYSMTSSAGESYGGMFAAERAALVGNKSKSPVVPTVKVGSSSGGKSKSGKTAAEEALERIKKKAQEAGAEIAAALTRLDAQNAALQEAKDAAAEGESRYYDSLRWENQEGLLGDTEYLDILKKRFADLSTELEGLGIDMQNVSNWSEPMRSTFSEMQSVVGTLASDQMELLRGQFENGALTNAQYLSALTAIKDQFAQYPAIVKMADQAIAAFNATTQNTLPTVANQVKAAWDDMEMSIAQVPTAMGDAFMSAIKGSQSLGDALNSLLADIGAVIAKALIMKYLVGPIMGFMGFADGGVFQGGQLTAFASGGVVNKPTLFPFANGIGLMGEAGPEAIMPLERGADGKLGVKNNAGGGQPVIINVLDKGDLEQVTYEAMAKYPGSQIVTNHVLRQRVERGSLAFGGAVR